MNTETTSPFNENPKFSLDLVHPRYFLTWLGMAILYSCKNLPYSLITKLGSFLGLLMLKLTPHRKEITQTNFKVCYPNKTEGEINDLVNKNFQNLGIGLFEMGIAWWSSKKTIRSLQNKFINKELLENTQNNKGTLVLMRHSTHLELDIRLMCLDSELGGMYKSQSNAVVNYLMIKARNRYVKGAVDNHGARKAISWMQQGYNFMYAADQDYGIKVSEFIPFFGVPSATVTLPENLSNTGIKVVLADVSRNASGFDIEIHEINPKTEKNQFLREMNECYENIISTSPDQYLWMHRRFKTRPGGQSAIYSKWKSRDIKRQKRREQRD